MKAKQMLHGGKYKIGNLIQQILRGIEVKADMTSYQDQSWLKLWRNNSTELRQRAIQWRRQGALVRLERPSRIERARRLGYKAKQGVIVVRSRVGTGGMRRKRPVAGRRPKHIGVTRIKPDVSLKQVAEKRAKEKYPNLSVLGSYFIYKDGMHYWYEVVLADPAHPSIVKDKEMRGKLKELKN